MVRKEMEGGNRARRQKAREAREHGKLPSEAGVTTGASKQRLRLHHEEHEEKLLTIRQGKQKMLRGKTPKPKPRSRPEGPPREWP
jgi:hypothetical protein